MNSVDFEVTKSVLRVAYETEEGNEVLIDIEEPKQNVTLSQLSALHVAVLAICGAGAADTMIDPVTGFKEAYYLNVEQGSFAEE